MLNRLSIHVSDGLFISAHRECGVAFCGGGKPTAQFQIKAEGEISISNFRSARLGGIRPLWISNPVRRRSAERQRRDYALLCCRYSGKRRVSLYYKGERKRISENQLRIGIFLRGKDQKEYRELSGGR